MTLEELFGKSFKSDDLSEEAQGKIVAVFQAKVKEGVEAGLVEARAEIQTEFDTKLNEEKGKIAESVDSYLNRIGESWLEENKLTIVEQSKIDLSENLFEDIKEVLAKHNVEMPEGKENLVEKKEKELKEMTDKYNKSVEAINAKEKELKEEKNSHVEFKRGLVIQSLTEDMADTQIEKVKSLTEAVEYVNAKDFKGKVEAVILSINEESEETEEEIAARLAKEAKVAEDLNEEKRRLEAEKGKTKTVNNTLF